MRLFGIDNRSASYRGRCKAMTDDLQTIYMISDGTCRTCEQVLKAVLLQFDAPKVHLVRKANVRRAKTVTKVIREAREKRAVVFYTLVLEEARRAVKASSLEYMVPVVHLLALFRSAS